MFGLQLRRNGSKQAERLQDMKNRIVKNEEVVLEAMGKRLQGNKACPFLLGAPCIGDACQFFTEYKSVNYDTGKQFPYWRCDFKQMPQLQIETNRNINTLREDIQKLIAALEEIRK